MLKLVIDLSKGRPKGSTNKDHKWIARYTNAKGQVIRVYPDKRHGEMTKDEQFKLKPGVSINQVISDAMIGGPTGETKKDGRPQVAEGEFMRYEVAHESELRDERKRENYTRNATSREKIGQHVVFGYPKVHAIEHDEKDKPTRFAGYTNIEYHPSVKAHGYRTPKKIEAFKVEPHEIKVDEDAPQRGFNAAELPTHGDRGPQRVAGGSVTGTGPIASPHPKKEHNLSMESIARREQIENLRLDDAVDPLEFAAKLYDKAALKAKEKTKPGAREVLAFQDWQTDKYHDRQELLDKLQKQPVATLISLGYAKPTATSRKLNEALIDEWTPVIMGLSGDNFSAFKETEDYRAAAARDAIRTKRGLKRNQGGTDSRKYVNALRRHVVSDLFQAGAEKLLRVARQYEVDPENNRHRFDKLAYASVANEIRKLSRIKAEEAGTLVPIKHESEVEQAMRENTRGGGSMEPLSPQEAAELKAVTPVARTALAEILPQLPDAYRRVVESRLWLDEPGADGDVPLLDAPQSRAETMTRKQRHEKLDAQIAEAEERGEVVARDRRKPRSWEREWTGFGSIADKYESWTDPETGTPFKIDEYSVGHQRELLQNYYRMGVAHIIRQLSVPVKRQKPTKGSAPVEHPRAFQPGAEWKQRENHVVVPLTNKDIARLSPEEQLTYTAVGGEPRVLTQQGKAVKRYLQIETKLATQNRRRWMAPSHVREVDDSVTAKTPVKSPRVAWKLENVSPLENQAVRFFASSANQGLAARLGMHDIGEYAQHTHQQNVSPGTYADSLYKRARKHYKVFNEVNNMTDKELNREHAQHTRRASVLHAELHGVKDDDTHKRILHDLSIAEGRVHIIDFVKQARGTTKSMVVTARDTPLSLTKAFLDYDFELDRLGVEFN